VAPFPSPHPYLHEHRPSDGAEHALPSSGDDDRNPSARAADITSCRPLQLLLLLR